MLHRPRLRADRGGKGHVRESSSRAPGGVSRGELAGTGGVGPDRRTQAAAVITAGGWGWQNPLPQGNDLWGVAALDAATTVAVGDLGTVVRANSVWERRSVGARSRARLGPLPPRSPGGGRRWRRGRTQSSGASDGVERNANTIPSGLVTRAPVTNRDRDVARELLTGIELLG
jgi:hypothetical protein